MQGVDSERRIDHGGLKQRKEMLDLRWCGGWWWQEGGGGGGRHKVRLTKTNDFPLSSRGMRRQNVKKPKEHLSAKILRKLIESTRGGGSRLEPKDLKLGGEKAGDGSQGHGEGEIWVKSDPVYR